jgi:peptidoglycan/xylan/chitin deacetylase (PgdA/CDA1 family)
MLKAALTHDVDRISKTTQYLTYSLRALLHGEIKKIEYNLKSVKNRKNEFWNFERIMEIEEQYSIRSTFFFLNEPVTYNIFDFENWYHSLGRYRLYENRVADIIKLLDKKGWEVGVHGSYSSYKSPGMLKKEKAELEEVLGKKVAGIRQHYLNLIPGKTWGWQSNAGFLYDSSWGFTKGIGFKNNIIAPFRPLKNNFVVFPLTIMDYCFMEEKERWSRLDRLCSDTEAGNGVLVINWHNNVFSKNDFPGSEETYIECIKRCRDKGAVFKKLEDFYRETV